MAHRRIGIEVRLKRWSLPAVSPPGVRLVVSFAEVAVVADRRCTPRAPLGEFAVDGTAWRGDDAAACVCEDDEHDQCGRDDENTDADGHILARKFHGVILRHHGGLLSDWR